MSFTFIIILITVLISIGAFNNEELYNKLILWPRKMDNPAEYYRLLTSGFIHADWNHLIFNMLSLYMLGGTAEYFVQELTGAGIMFIVLYLSGIIVSSLPSFIKNRNNSYYRSLGASGGVASLVFFFIYYAPWAKLGILFIPIGIPAILFGGLYLAYEIYMSKRGHGNVNHDAHLWGSLYGLFFGFLLDSSHGVNFVNSLLRPQ